MKRLIHWTVNILFLGAIAGALVFMLGTETGLQWSFRLLQSRLPGHLTAAEVSGRLIGPLSLKDLHYEDHTITVGVGDLTLDWQPLRLLGGSVHIRDLAIDDLRVVVRESPPESRQPGRTRLPNIELPVAVGIEQMTVHAARIELPNHEPFVIDSLAFSGIAHDAEVTVATLHAEGPALKLDAEGRVPLSETGALRLEARLETRFDGREIAAEASASGTPRKADFDFHLSKPVGLRVSGHVDNLGEVPRWRLNATADPMVLTSLLPAARPVRLTRGELEAHGRGLDIEASGQFAVVDPEFGGWTARAAGRWNRETWEVSKLELEAATGGTRIDAGAGGTSGAIAEGRYHLQASWQALGWPLANPHISSPQGRLSAAGSLDDYTIELEGDLQPPAVPLVRLKAEGRGDRNAVHVTSIAGQWLNGEWSGNGLLAFRPEPRWEAQLNARHVDLATVYPAATSALDATVQGSGRLAGDFGFDIGFERIAGTLNGRPAEARGRLALHDGDFELGDVAVRSGSATAAADLRLGGDWRGKWRLEAGNIGDLVTGATGSVRLSGTFDRPDHDFRIHVDGEGRQLAYRKVRVDTAKLAAAIDLSPTGEWQASLEARGIDVAGTTIAVASLTTSGTTARHAITLHTEAADLDFQQRISGTLRDGRWRAELLDGRLQQPRLGVWQQTDSARLEVSSDGSFEFDGYCLAEAAASTCLRAQRPADGTIAGDLSWRGVDLARISPLIAELTLLDVTGTTAGSIAVHYGDGRLRDARLELTARSGAVRYFIPGQENLHLLSFQTVSISAQADRSRGLMSKLEVRFTATERLTAGLELPGWDIGLLALPDSQTVTGNLQIHLRDVSAVSLFVPDLSPVEGDFKASVRLSGTIGAPSFDGEAALDVPKVALPRLGTQLEAVKLETRVARNHLTLEATARLGSGTVNVDGNGTLEDLDHWEAEIHIKGDTIEAVRQPSLQVVASPDVTLRLRPGELVVDGRITIPRARLEPLSREQTVSASPDVVVVGKEQAEPPPPPFRLYGRLELVLGDDVRLKGKGVEGRLTGTLLLIGDSKGNVTGQGEIQLLDGRYRAYGQNLTIKQGRLLFAGGPLDNPALNIEASRTRGQQNEIEVGVRVLGTAQKPELQLFSTPTMDDADILSYLVVGRPMNQVQQGEGQQLYQAANSVALVGGEALAERIAQRFDLFEVSVETSETTNEPALVLGRALSPRLYLRYLQGLAESSSALQIRYRLSKRWLLETESGTRTGAGGDLLYIYEH